MKFRFVKDLTSDVVFEAFGKDNKELFENAGLALMSVICQVDKIAPLLSKDVEVEGENEKDLLFNWLQKLIEMVDIENVFFSKFEIKKISGKHMIVKCFGEGSDPSRGGTLVKAVTYYKFNIEKTNDGFKATVSLDI
ncbi:MAG: archease [Candidatus Aenigmarchaeota archaeon]|nr:archease [Candidatus Aenigmarchaeota archaeon]